MIQTLKAVLASYVVTGILLLILTILVYQFEIEEKIVDMGIVATYVSSTFIGGFILGKLAKKRRFLWGTLVGVLYIGFLYGISYALYGVFELRDIEALKPILLCLGGGMFGGMMS